MASTPLDKHTIHAHLNNPAVALTILETVDSTNQYLHAFLPEKKIHVCFAEQQTQGRGRFDRAWHSPHGVNIYGSCLYYFNQTITELSGLSVVVSLAVHHTLQTYVTDSIKIKWPNDLLYDHQKLSGILIDTYPKKKSCAVIIGIGINVNMVHDDHTISQPWTSLQRITNHSVDRNPLCVSLINNLMVYLEKLATHGFSAFIDEWKSVDYLQNRLVTLTDSQNKTAGKVIGIDAQGFLLIETNTGKMLTVRAGDVLMGAYSYL